MHLKFRKLNPKTSMSVCKSLLVLIYYMYYSNSLKQHLNICDKQCNYIDAEITRQKINQLKKKQEKIFYKEITQRHKHDRQQLLKEQKNEIKNFNNKMTSQYNEMIIQIDQMKTQLKHKQENELNEHIQRFKSSLPNEPKESFDLIKARKQLENYVKQKEYVFIYVYYYFII